MRSRMESCCWLLAFFRLYTTICDIIQKTRAKLDLEHRPTKKNRRQFFLSLHLLSLLLLLLLVFLVLAFLTGKYEYVSNRDGKCGSENRCQSKKSD